MTARDCWSAGLADYAFHTHNGDCYDGEGQMVCPLPEILAHRHDGGCLDEAGEPVCGKPERFVHTHGPSCYDELGVLSCGLLQTEEHVHGPECFTLVGINEEVLPEEPALPAQQFEGEAQGVRVRVEAPEGAFPEGTTLVVSPVDGEEVLDAAAEAVEGDVVRVHAVDITFLNGDGQEIEPLREISVTLSAASLAELPETEEPVVVHVTEEGRAQVVEDAVSDADAGQVSFDAGDFSVYAIVVRQSLSARVLTASGGTFDISVTYGPEAALPEGAQLRAEEVTAREAPDDFEEYTTRAAEALEGEVAQARLFDISILAGGEKVEPAASVSVKIALEDGEAPPEGEVSVVHFGEEGLQVITPEETGDQDAVAFQTDSFSLYAVTWVLPSPEPPAPLPDDLNGREYTIVSNIGSAGMLSETEADTFAPKLGLTSKGVTVSAGNTYSDPEVLLWRFDRVGDGVYRLSAEVGGVRKYLSFDDGNLTLAEDVADASDVTVKREANEMVSLWNGAYVLNINGGQPNGGFHLVNRGAGAAWPNDMMWLCVPASDDPSDYPLVGEKYVLGKRIQWNGTSIPGFWEFASLVPTLKGDGNLEAERLLITPTKSEVAADKREKYSDLNLLSLFDDPCFWEFEETGTAGQYYLSTNDKALYLSISGTGEIQLTAALQPVRVEVDGVKGVKLTDLTGTYTLSLAGNLAENGYETSTTDADPYLALFVRDRLLHTEQNAARKSAVTDLQDGDIVVIYHDFVDEYGNFTTFAVGKEGDLVPVKTDGDNVYYWEDLKNGLDQWEFRVGMRDDDPTRESGYYFFHNAASGKYLLPQKDGAFMTDEEIGLNLPGRDDEEYRSTIVAWDTDGWFGLQMTETEAQVSAVPEAEATTFVFAVVTKNDSVAKLDGGAYHLGTLDPGDTTRYAAMTRDGGAYSGHPILLGESMTVGPDGELTTEASNTWHFEQVPGEEDIFHVWVRMAGTSRYFLTLTENGAILDRPPTETQNITVKKVGDDYVLYREIGGVKYALSPYGASFGDWLANGFGTSVLADPEHPADSQKIRLMDPPDPLTTVNTVNGVPGMTIRMFDYPDEVNYRYDGIQAQLLGPETDDTNTGDGRITGLVKKTLGADGFPVTTGQRGSSGSSLAPLFDGTYGTTPARANNTFFLQSTYNETGYYEFSSAQNFAHYDRNSGLFIVYDQIAVPYGEGEPYFQSTGDTNKISNKTSASHGNFFPFNDLTNATYAANQNFYDEDGKQLDPDDPRIGEGLYLVENPDYQFGMSLEASFYQPLDGKTASGDPVTYSFNGDDDLWVFIDDMLVLDIGGIHGALTGTVNFATGEVYIPNAVNPTILGRFVDAWEEAGKSTAEIAALTEQTFKVNADGNYVFKDYSAHTLKMFYMERGRGASNLHVKFNLPMVEKNHMRVSKTLTGVQPAYTNTEQGYRFRATLNRDGTHVLDGDYYEIPEIRDLLGEGDNFPYIEETEERLIFVKEDEDGNPDPNGDSYFYLKPNQTAVFPLPDGDSEYVVAELLPSEKAGDYTTTYNGVESTSATWDDRTGVGVNNDYKNPLELRIQKTVSAAAALKSANAAFQFRVYLENPDGDLVPYDRGDYYILHADGIRSASNKSSPNGAISGIKDGDIIVIEGLMDGTDFLVFEDGMPDGYVTDSVTRTVGGESSADTSSILTGDWAALPYAKGTLVKPESGSIGGLVTVTNQVRPNVKLVKTDALGARCPGRNLP